MSSEPTEGISHAPPHHHHDTSTVAGGGANSTILYRECLKNHAANVGGNVTDGCGEFMPAGEEATESFLKCAACGCHRSFHRKDTPDGGAGDPVGNGDLPALPSFASMTQMNNAWASLAASKTVAAFGGGAAVAPAAAASGVEMMSFHAHQSSAPSTTKAKKRFRTKFTQEQKMKMMKFAEKIGWRVPREEEGIKQVQRFCGEIGVKRQVFKVWMHNNKNSAQNNNVSHNNNNNNVQSTISPSSSVNIS